MPPFLVYIALFWLILTSFNAFYEEKMNTQIVIFYLSGIGLSISLASASFSYARVCEESNKKQIVWGGEHFFYAAILLITALLINWLAMELRPLFNNHIILNKVKFILIWFLILSYASAGFAAQDISRGFRILDKVLFKRTYD